MKNLKRFTRGSWLVGLGSVCLLLAGTPAALAQSTAAPFHSTPFLADGIASLVVSNTISYTNLLSPGVVTTNASGLSWTNTVGYRYVVATNSATASDWTNETTRLTRDVVLWTDRAGLMTSNVNVTVKITGQTAFATNAITFIMAPVPDGTNEITTTTGAMGTWTWSVTPNGTTPVVLATNAPLTAWQGAGKLRLRSVVPPTAVSGQNNAVAILSLTYNGFTP